MEKVVEKILITGATGFVGRNVYSILNKDSSFKISILKRQDIDLLNEDMLCSYLEKEHFDCILHFANPSPGRNNIDTSEKLVEQSLRIFMNFYNHSNLFGKIIYTGSGAEFSKKQDLDFVNETKSMEVIPQDSYGFSKMIMNCLASKSTNFYNFRLFGCYGPYDYADKFITHCIRSVLNNVPITIRKDCQFDYLHVEDFARYIKWGIVNDLAYHEYNITSGKQVLLSEIARIVLDLMSSNLDIRVLSEERNFNYTGDNRRVVEESHLIPKIDIRQGIKKQIEWECMNFCEDTIFDGE